MELELGCSFCKKSLATSRIEQPNVNLRKWIADLVCKKCDRLIIVEVDIKVLSDHVSPKKRR